MMLTIRGLVTRVYCKTTFERTTGQVPVRAAVTDTIPADFRVLDERFRYCNGDFVVERLYTGARKTEGPAYFLAGRYVVWSDIPNDRLMRWDETTGAVGVFRESSGYANGNTVDRDGRLVTCEQ